MKLAEARDRVPLGSMWGYWEVIGIPFAGGAGVGHQVRSRCTFIKRAEDGICGNERNCSVSWLLNGRAKACKSCSKWKGEYHPRNPSVFRDEYVELQQGICAWPPCSQPLDDKVVIDHNHKCVCGPEFACTRCVRGAVHPYCNGPLIASCDMALLLGAVFPPDIQAYLLRGEPS